MEMGKKLKTETEEYIFIYPTFNILLLIKTCELSRVIFRFYSNRYAEKNIKSNCSEKLFLT